LKTIAIIPARYASTRFPGKPLIDIGGTTMIQRVHQQASKSQLLDRVVIATDDQRIFDHVSGFGGEVIMTAMDHPTGTDRCVETLTLVKDSYEIVINIQGDEPFIQPEQIDLLIRFFKEEYNQYNIATLAKEIDNLKDLHNSNCVKLVFDDNFKALYFSRFPIPFLRGIDKSASLNHHRFYKHIGLYIYKSSCLSKLTKLPLGHLEKAESLEQLRWMQAGHSIGVCITDLESHSIDTPEDLISLGY